MNKQERINEYNKNNKGYNITNIKKMSQEQLGYYTNSNKTIWDLYQRPSYAKEKSYSNIIEQYKPNRILGLVGSSQSYSITLEAQNGDILYITKDNNYLVGVTQ